jgi:hypothetical protein
MSMLNMRPLTRLTVSPFMQTCLDYQWLLEKLSSYVGTRRLRFQTTPITPALVPASGFRDSTPLAGAMIR